MMPFVVNYPVDWGGAQPTPPAAQAAATVVEAADALARRTTARGAGLIIAAVSILCSAPDATLLRCLQQDGTSNTTILVWKMFLYSVLQGAFGVHQEGSLQLAVRKSVAAWPWMAIGSLCMSVEWLATLASLTTTSASALCLFYIAPLWAVPMGMVRDTRGIEHERYIHMTEQLLHTAAD